MFAAVTAGVVGQPMVAAVVEVAATNQQINQGAVFIFTGGKT